MFKSFISQSELTFYKYQPSSKYYGKTMAYNFVIEILDYSMVNKFLIY